MSHVIHDWGEGHLARSPKSHIARAHMPSLFHSPQDADSMRLDRWLMKNVCTLGFDGRSNWMRPDIPAKWFSLLGKISLQNFGWPGDRGQGSDPHNTFNEDTTERRPQNLKFGFLWQQVFDCGNGLRLIWLLAVYIGPYTAATGCIAIRLSFVVARL